MTSQLVQFQVFDKLVLEPSKCNQQVPFIPQVPCLTPTAATTITINNSIIIYLDILIVIFLLFLSLPLFLYLSTRTGQGRLPPTQNQGLL